MSKYGSWKRLGKQANRATTFEAFKLNHLLFTYLYTLFAQKTLYVCDCPWFLKQTTAFRKAVAELPFVLREQLLALTSARQD